MYCMYDQINSALLSIKDLILILLTPDDGMVIYIDIIFNPLSPWGGSIS